MIDTHCHLNFEAFSGDYSDVIKKAESEGVTKFIVPGAKLDSSEKAIFLSQQFSNVFAAVGVHPHHRKEFNEEVLKKLEELIKNERAVAVGEIGLDFKRDLPLQIECFKKQLELAIKYNKPCIIHCREAYIEIDNFLEKYKLRGVFHCFTGDLDHLNRVLKMGFYVSFAGNITYDKSYDLLIKNVPVDKLLLETDSPYLAPSPLRGQRNEPKNIVYIASYIASIKNIGLNSLVKQATINSEDLFKLC